MKKKRFYNYILILLLSINFSCQKEFLEKKPDKALLVPETLTDFQQLLDNSSQVMNFTPLLNSVSCDDVYIPDHIQVSFSPFQQRAYRWEKDIYEFTNIYNGDWDRPYQQVFYCNIVLEGLQSLSDSEKSSQAYNDVKGQALFARALAFYNLSQEYCAPHGSGNEGQQLGIPLKLESDINAKTERSTIEQTYKQIISDLEEATELLPEKTQFLTRSSKPAAFGLLSRVYLAMRSYEKAGEFASKALEFNNKILDYNTITSTGTYKMPRALANLNPEIIFYSILASTPISYDNNVFIDTVLQKAYDNNDLRKNIWFRIGTNGMLSFRGSYSGNNSIFTGIATDELIITKAECLARGNKVAEAMKELNKLLVKRWKTSSEGNSLYVEQTAAGKADALKKILLERRKELLWRNLRWTDLRRLNQEPEFAVTLRRIIAGQTITLAPNDKRYVLPIPETVIVQTGMQQNPR
ncbi:RagB/SusD family nutrient uptake outer membrane protein [Sphingobacterium siyangense]|uniref:RagB/SusD family nutrient uptake outer membrane protein n=1 Tax=Sphingobacterium siyangense TaxID=459529 RepID=UPI003DA62C45